MPEKFQRQIYLLSPKRLSPETIAVTFAKTSRSPLTFQEIASELTDKESAEFHEKWVVGYGHGSVAEHAVLHIAFENVSRLAIECIESNRLASYTEKSTRYQQWDPGSFYIPQEIQASPLESEYSQTCDRLFRTYQLSIDPLRKVIQKRFPKREGEDDARWDLRLRSKYIDACRYLLPSAAFANVGMTINARALEIAIRKMLSNPLTEIREIGQAVKEVAQEEVPTLVKYAEGVPYLRETTADLAKRASVLQTAKGNDPLRLVAYQEDAELMVMAAALYEQGTSSYDVALISVRKLGQPARMELAKSLLGRLGRFDVPVRALEHAVYTFEVLLDQGAYFELKRHRMMTQSPQRLTSSFGYAVPKLFTEAGIEGVYRETMEETAEVFQAIETWNPHVAAYVVPNGFNRRVLCSLNLRQIFHLCELRSQPNAHFSIRRISLQMAEMVQKVHPMLASFLRLPEGADWRWIETEHFSQV